MNNTVTFVTTYLGMHLNVFLVVLNRVGYLICWEPETMEFGYMCPCCMYPEHREAIAYAVELGLHKGEFDGKVRWCCHKEHTQYGDSLGNDYSSLNGELFCSGNAEVDLAEMKEQIQAEAERQLALGNITRFERK